MTTKPNRIERYYETHEWEGDEVGQGRLHFVVIKYLVAVIEWLFYGQAVGVMSDVYIFQTTEYKEAPLSPDLVVVDGLNLESAETEEKPSYQIGEDGPPPRVVIEVSSKSTWLDDLNPKGKRNKYFAVGIPEYFVFDPQQTTLWRDSWAKCNRLVGWRRNPLTGEYEELVKDEVGRLWSEELQSWLVVEGRYLRLYTRDGQLRLTEAQAERQQLNLERAKARAALQEEKQQRELERAKARAALQEEKQQRELERVKARAALQEEKQQRELERVKARAALQEEKQQRELERARADAAQQQRELERARADAAQQQRELERARADAAQQQRELEQTRADAAEQRLAKLLEQLRQSGQNPDDLS